MLSQLGSVFKTTFRQAESTDARLEIRREEKENNGKKKDAKKDADDDAVLWEDSMTVSVIALHTFLLEFLKSHGAPLPQEEQVILDTAVSDYHEVRPPVSSVAARAVKAYTAMAPAQPSSMSSASVEPSAPVNSDDLLSAEEIRAVHILIADVDGLTKAGVQTVNITIIGTFLESLIEAVRLTKLAPRS